MHILADSPDPKTFPHIVRDLRGDAVGEIDCPSAPAGLYPEVILQLAARLTDEHAATPYQFFDLWELVLAHWFPEREGYTIKHQWPIPYLHDRDGVADITFTVLDGDAAIVLLQVSAPSDFQNVHTRSAAEALSGSHFEHVAPYCTYDHPLCAIAAMGKKWTAYQRLPKLTAREGQSLGEERIDWMDDIVSEPSYEMLDCFFSSVKEGVRTERLQRRVGGA
ncbi:hypothetical protein GGX14DRAFT_452340 [Mycena pura]|uniref:Uncharacterized protein n=1 Tax=Mycena pura TaxID=153505 RepID=A0AAD6VD76_9AGAR|nr:hypothetical protein GGX14DRAFT_452340 [Mycena pura]